MTPHETDFSLPGLTLSFRSQDGYTITAISGDLDIARVPAVREQLLATLGPHVSRIVVDLAGVTFCDASGLAVLIGVSRRAWLLDGRRTPACSSSRTRSTSRSRPKSG